MTRRRSYWETVDLHCNKNIQEEQATGNYVLAACAIIFYITLSIHYTQFTTCICVAVLYV